MNIFSDNFIKVNNARILSPYKTQPRYVPETKIPKSEQQEPCENSKNVMSVNHIKFLDVIYQNPLKKLTDIYKLASIPLVTGFRITEKCVKMNLITIIQVSFIRGRPKYPILFPDGYKALGVKQKTFNHRGAGYEHSLYQNFASTNFEILNPIIELNRNGKFIDVGIEKNGLLIAIEIAITSVHEKENIEKDITLAKADFVIVACINEKVQEKVNEIVSQMSENIQNRSEVCLLSEFLKRKPEELLINQTKFNL